MINRTFKFIWDMGGLLMAADEELMQDGSTFHVNKEEWLCKGKWLYHIPEAHNWYFVKEEDQELVV